MAEYQPSERAQAVLVKGRILAPNETPQDMFKRVTDSLFSVEEGFGTSPKRTARLKDAFAELFAGRYFSPGTPTLTNAGRTDHANYALSSCVVIPVDLRDREVATETITSYYKQNMGSGFDFTPYADPVGMLVWLNDLSARETATGQYERYIGNMGNLDVAHPKIREFIAAKKERRLIHFNISVAVNESFMEAALEGRKHRLADGTAIDAGTLLAEMSDSAWFNGDPGIIYLDRMNRDNPVEMLSAYTSTPPCSEMGLALGETCQFGYVNLARFAGPLGVDYKKLGEATTVMTRVLDNAIQVSSSAFPNPESLRLANLKRKIGIGVCGLADMLITSDLSYDSPEAISLARDVLSFINFTSKEESIRLAEERGSCGAMLSFVGNKYYDGFLDDRYKGTNTVAAREWMALSGRIRETGSLRNILTTALPPTGRASILLGSNSAIEPPFSATTHNDGTEKIIRGYIAQNSDDPERVWAQAQKEGSFQGTALKRPEVLKTAKEIHHLDHLRMVAALAGTNGVYDEAASKTVNLASKSTPQDVLKIFTAAQTLGLKCISVYRDGSLVGQQSEL